MSLDDLSNPRASQSAMRSGSAGNPLVTTNTGIGSEVMAAKRSPRRSSGSVVRYASSLSPMICTRPGLMYG